MLCCPERAEVRQFLRQWAGQRAPHTLENVKAHYSAGVRSGSSKAFGNDKVDGLAKEAARGVTLTYKSDMCFIDVVLFQNSSGAMISDVGKAVMLQWWDQQRRAGAARRTWLARLYRMGWRWIGRFRPTFFRLRLWFPGLLYSVLRLLL